MKAVELARVAKKIKRLKFNHSDAALWEVLCKEEKEFCKEFWGEDYMRSFGEQSPGYFADTWADTYLKEHRHL